MRRVTGFVLMFILGSVLITSTAISAYAIQLDTTLITQRDRAESVFRAVNVLYIEYPNGGNIKTLLQGNNDQIEFTADRNTPGMPALIQRINNNLVNQKQSPVVVEDAKLTYRAVLSTDDRRAVLENTVRLELVVTRFVLHTGSPAEGTLIDLNWRGWFIDEPIVVRTEEYGDINISQLGGYFYSKMPEVIQAFEGTRAMEMFNRPVLDFRELTDLSIDKWHWLFDPSGSIAEAERYGFREQEGAALVTFFSAGEGGLREGIHREKTMRYDVTADGTNYTVSSTTPPSSATIQVLGYAVQRVQGGNEGAIVWDFVPEGVQQTYNPDTILVLGGLGVLMGAIAGFVLWRANKKS